VGGEVGGEVGGLVGGEVGGEVGGGEEKVKTTAVSENEKVMEDEVWVERGGRGDWSLALVSKMS